MSWPTPAALSFDEESDLIRDPEPYIQCRLERQMPEGVCHLISWIPAQYAARGNTLRLKNEKGEWEEGWLVVAGGDKVKSGDEIERDSTWERHDQHFRPRSKPDSGPVKFTRIKVPRCTKPA